jgi:SanA protein
VHRKTVIRVLRDLVLLGVLFTLAGNWWVLRAANARLHERLDAVPAAEVGLVLGCSARLADGRANLYFRHRVDAAAALYRAGKVRHLLVSGDNHVSTYSEPDDLRDALMERGVPREDITLDYAGFRTLDSMFRARDVFGLQRVIVVSQPWHAARAIYLGRQHGLTVDAYCARDVRGPGLAAAPADPRGAGPCVDDPGRARAGYPAEVPRPLRAHRAGPRRRPISVAPPRRRGTLRVPAVAPR